MQTKPISLLGYIFKGYSAIFNQFKYENFIHYNKHMSPLYLHINTRGRGHDLSGFQHLKRALIARQEAS
jgi:hypothetical protein